MFGLYIFYDGFCEFIIVWMLNGVALRIIMVLIN